ncbi:MAG: hypothetical protein ABGY75_08310, partial [Gemmataceae bacterium]
EYKVGLEDLANTNLGPNWDYDDLVFLVRADDGTSPPPPPNTVGASPPYVPGMTVEFLDRSYQGQTDGMVAKWGTAYEEEPGPPGKVRVKNNFVASDDDRYFIRMKDSNYAGQPNLTRTARVSSDSDLGNDLTLHAVPDDGGVFRGEFWSDPFVLVSNAVDAEWVVNGKADNATDHPTFRVKLGDTLSIDYTSIAVVQTIHKRVPIRVIKDVKVHVTVMTVALPPGQQGPPSPVASQAQVDQWMTMANETYAQVGVRLTWGQVQFADEPAGVNLSNGLRIAGAQREDIPMLRGRNAGTNQPYMTAATDDVELFLVNYFADAADTSLPAVRGMSITASGVIDPAFADLADSSIVSVTNKYPFTIAHEIGHVLTNAGHYGDPPATLTPVQVQPNLMRDGTSAQDRLDPYQETVNNLTFWTTGSKRLNDDQQTAIYTQRTEIVKDFIP